MSTAHDDHPSDAVPTAAPPADGSGRGLMIGMAVGYLLVGLLAATAARLFAPGKPTPADATAEAKDANPTDAGHEPESHSAEAAHRAVGKKPATADEAIRSGQFREALELVRAARPADGPPNAASALQEGACLESLGRWKEAAAAYQPALDPDGDPGAWAQAALGTARAALARHDHAAANALISQVALRSGQPACRAVRATEEAVLLRARLALQHLGSQPTPDPLDAAAVAWADLAGGLDQYPDWQKVPPRPTPSRSADEPVRVTPNVAHPDRGTVSADLPTGPVLDILQRIASAAGMTVEIDPSAAAKLTGKTTTAETDGLPLADLVAAIVEPHELHGRVSADAIEVFAGSHGTDRLAVRGALQRAAAVAPSHPRARAARLAAANLALAAGRPKDAIDEYRKLLTDFPHAAEARPAAINLGLAHLSLGDPAAARSAFLHAVDRAKTPADAAVGQWWVGRSHLDAGDPAAAVRPLRAALNGPSKPARSAAALGLAAAYLLTGDDFAAEGVLRRHPVAANERHAAQAAFLTALFRFRGNPTALRGEAVLTAAAAADNGLSLGPAGVFLAGQAYRDCGLGGPMAELYDRTLGTVRGRLANRMQYAVGVQLLADGRPTDARPRLQAVLAADPDGLGLAAGLKLAELAARDGRGAECIAACQALLARSGADRPAVLAVMGRGYELAGEFRHAAECFAGRPPGAGTNVSLGHEKAP